MKEASEKISKRHPAAIQVRRYQVATGGVGGASPKPAAVCHIPTCPDIGDVTGPFQTIAPNPGAVLGL